MVFRAYLGWSYKHVAQNYLFISISFDLFIAILCAKMSRVNKALEDMIILSPPFYTLTESIHHILPFNSNDFPWTSADFLFQGRAKNFPR